MWTCSIKWNGMKWKNMWIDVCTWLFHSAPCKRKENESHKTESIEMLKFYQIQIAPIRNVCERRTTENRYVINIEIGNTLRALCLMTARNEKLNISSSSNSTKTQYESIIICMATDKVLLIRFWMMHSPSLSSYPISTSLYLL